MPWPADLVTATIVTPQCAPSAPEERRVVLADEGLEAIDLEPQTVAVDELNQTPARAEIGGSMGRVYQLAILWSVQHGDPDEARTRRNLIARDFTDRLSADPSLGAAVSPDADEAITLVSWSLETIEAGLDTFRAYGSLALRVETEALVKAARPSWETTA